jgi:hypothetical protein
MSIGNVVQTITSASHSAAAGKVAMSGGNFSLASATRGMMSGPNAVASPYPALSADLQSTLLKMHENGAAGASAFKSDAVGGATSTAQGSNGHSVHGRAAAHA